MQLHVRLLPVLLCYFALRWAVLGSAIADTGPPAVSHDLSTWITMQASKLQACVAPSGSLLPASTPFTLGLSMAWVVIGGLVWPANRRWIAAGLAWLAVSFLPLQWHMVTPNMGTGRIVLAPLVGIALVVAAVIGGTSGPRWFRAVGGCFLLVAIINLATAARAIQSAYWRAWDQMRVLRLQVDDAGSRATAAAPMVLIAGVPMHDEIPFLSPTMAFAIASRPLARNDHAFLSLGFSLVNGVGPEMLEGEIGPWRALWQHGATMCYWSTEFTAGQLALVEGPAADRGISLVAGSSGFAVQGGNTSPWPIGGIEVLADAAFAGGELIWHTGAGQVGRRPITRARQTAAGFSAIVDLTEDLEFMIWGTLAGISRFTVELTPPAGGRSHSLRVVAPAPPSPLQAPLRGASVALTELAQRLPLASVPPDADPGSTTAVLMNGACMFRVWLTANGMQLPVKVRDLLVEVDRFMHSDHVYYYLECRLRGKPWRSEIDWFRRRCR